MLGYCNQKQRTDQLNHNELLRSQLRVSNVTTLAPPISPATRIPHTDKKIITEQGPEPAKNDKYLPPLKKTLERGKLTRPPVRLVMWRGSDEATSKQQKRLEED
jgi:hypothetical protein